MLVPMASQQACPYTFFILLLIACPFTSCVLVPSTPLNLQYHKGLLLAGDGPIKLHLTFYGDFTSLEKDTIKAFLHSLSDTPSYIAQFSSYKKAPHIKSRRLSLKSASVSSSELKPLVMKGSSTEEDSKPLAGGGSAFKFSRDASKGPSSMREPSPTVAQWWSLTRAYTDLCGNGVCQTVLIEHEVSDNYSHGKLLSHSNVASLAKSSARRAARGVSHATEDNFNVHLIFTAADVAVEGFCMHACAQHAHTQSDGELGKVVYAWVGNARKQCPGYCAWPFVRAEYGPDMEPLKAPNSAGADGMIVNLAKVLAEAATNPYGDGYYVGNGVGVGGVCTGAYGDGAFPGYPGRTLQDPHTGASFNVKGLQHFKFLLPYIWNPLTLSCAVQPEPARALYNSIQV